MSIGVIENDRSEVSRLWVLATSPDASESAKVYRVHAHSSAWENIRLEDGAKRYALKYALKTRQKEVPVDYSDVGRFWGCSRDVSVSAREVSWETDCSEWDARKLAELSGRDMSNWENLPRDIFLPSCRVS
jgi:hypothetical protein